MMMDIYRAIKRVIRSARDDIRAERAAKHDTAKGGAK